MSVDRGGLRYEIDIQVRNLRHLKAVRDEIARTIAAQRRAVAVARQATTAAKQASVAATASATAQAKANTRAAREQARQATANAQNVEATRQAAQAIQKQTGFLGRLNAVFGTARGRLKQYTAEQAAAARESRRLRNEMAHLEGRANRISFTFRRLFGILAAFAIARRGIQAFSDLIAKSIAFDNTIERSRIGIAGILTSVAQLTDAQGNLVEGGEKYAESLKIADQFMQKIRLAALDTEATIPELVQATQIALSQALSVGITDPNKIVRIAQVISQTASAFDVPQNQLSEEIRSILTGTAADRVTRLARAFGVSAKELNEQIKEATRAGRLYEFITERLAGFAQAGKDAAETLTGLTARFQDALGASGGVAAEGLLDALKESLREIIDLLTPLGPDGLRLVNPEAVAALQPIFDGIAAAVTTIREGLSKTDFGTILSVTRGIGAAFRLAGQAASVLVRDVAAGLSGAFRIIESVGGTLVGIFESIGLSGSGIVSFLLRAATLMTTLSIVAGTVKGTIALIVGPLTTVFGLLKKGAIFIGLWNIGTLAILAKILAIPAIVIGLIEGFRQIIKLTTGLDISFKAIITLIKDGFVEGFKFVVASGKAMFTGLGAVIVGIFTDVFIFLADKISFVLRKMADLASLFSKSIAGTLQDAANGLDGLAAGAQKIQDDALDTAKGFFAEADAALTRLQNTLAKDLINGLKDEKKTVIDAILEAVAPVSDAVKKAMAGIIGADAVDQKAVVDAVIAAMEEAEKRLKEKTADINAPFRLPDLDENFLKDRQREEGLIDLRERNLKLQTDTAAMFKNETQARRGALRAELSVLGQRGRLLEDEARKRMESLEAQRANALTEQDRASLAAAIAEETERASLEMGLLSERALQVQLELDQIGEGGFFDGIKAGMQELVRSIDPFVSGFRLIQDFANDLSQTLAEALAEPKEAGKKLLDFFKHLATSIIAELLRIQIIKAIIGLSGGSIGSSGKVTGGIFDGLSFWKGGKVPHSRARGYAEGGPPIRPAGLDPRDTVPAWLAPGEFVQTVAAVRTYGADVMEAIRQRMIDPVALRSLARGARLPSAPRLSRGPGFAEGGGVSPARTTRGGRLVVEVRSRDIVNDGLSSDTLRIVSPGIKAPRNVAESRGI